MEHEPTAGLGVGLFGASTGAAAALATAAARPAAVEAIVSRGGRPDLAGDLLHLVHQPTLLIVGERDVVVIELNRKAMEELSGEKRLEIVPGATHLFEEPGAFEGEIPPGEYGAGTVVIWDRGTYECEKWTDREVKVVLHGERAQGRYVLFKTGDRQWIIRRLER